MRRALLLVLVVVGVVVAGPAAADSGPWSWPLDGAQEVTRSFAPPESRYGAGHRGVDVAAVPRAAVRASADGRVTYAGQLAGRGVVVVTHGALRTTYEPVTALVQLGQPVSRGEVVGRLEAGHLGCAAAACLHWGLRRGEEYLDPVRLVRGGPLRLLPPGPAPAPGAGLAPPAPRLAPPAPAPAPTPLVAVPEPAWSLRTAEAPLGVAAVAALVIGIGLIARPRTDPPAPVGGGAAAPAGRSVVPEEPDGPDALLLDLGSARLRRDAAS